MVAADPIADAVLVVSDAGYALLAAGLDSMQPPLLLLTRGARKDSLDVFLKEISRNHLTGVLTRYPGHILIGFTLHCDIEGETANLEFDKKYDAARLLALRTGHNGD